MFLTSVRWTWIKRIKKILNLKNKGQMTIVPLILISSSQTHRALSLTSGLGAAFPVAALQKHQREGRPRLQVRAQGGAASRARGCLPVAAPRCGRGLPLGAGRPRRPPAGRRRRRPAAAHRRRPPAGPGGARPRVVFFLWAPGFVAAGAGGSGAWTRLPVAPGSGSPFTPSAVRPMPRGARHLPRPPRSWIRQ